MLEHEVTRRPSPGFKRLQRSTQTRSPIPTESTRFTLASTNLCPLLHSWSAVSTWLIGDDPTCVKSSRPIELVLDPDLEILVTTPPSILDSEPTCLIIGASEGKPTSLRGEAAASTCTFGELLTVLSHIYACRQKKSIQNEQFSNKQGRSLGHDICQCHAQETVTCTLSARTSERSSVCRTTPSVPFSRASRYTCAS